MIGYIYGSALLIAALFGLLDAYQHGEFKRDAYPRTLLKLSLLFFLLGTFLIGAGYGVSLRR